MCFFHVLHMTLTDARVGIGTLNLAGVSLSIDEAVSTGHLVAVAAVCFTDCYGFGLISFIIIKEWINPAFL